MTRFLLWLILLVLCWPLAFLGLLFYPVFWLLALPFRLVGVVMRSLLDFVEALLSLPARVLRGPARA